MTELTKEQREFTYWRCDVCEFDIVAHNYYSQPMCPLCLEDSGHAETMRGRAARDSDRPEGRDDRKNLSP
jgi:hypothetical protein